MEPQNTTPAIPPKKFTDEWLNELFTYHAADEVQKGQYEEVRSKAKELARSIIANCPDCADRTFALRGVRECVMTANAAIALNGLV